MSSRIFVGVCRVAVHVPGARNRKDRRRAVVSLRDRVRHRFDVTFHEVGEDERSPRAVVVMTTAGNDQLVIRSMLDRMIGWIHSNGNVVADEVDVDVFRWHPSSVGDWEDPPHG